MFYTYSSSVGVEGESSAENGDSVEEEGLFQFGQPIESSIVTADWHSSVRTAQRSALQPVAGAFEEESFAPGDQQGSASSSQIPLNSATVRENINSEEGEQRVSVVGALLVIPSVGLSPSVVDPGEGYMVNGRDSDRVINEASHLSRRDGDALDDDDVVSQSSDQEGEGDHRKATPSMTL